MKLYCVRPKSTLLVRLTTIAAILVAATCSVVTAQQMPLTPSPFQDRQAHIRVPSKLLFSQRCQIRFPALLTARL